jgi:hypothetical protein
MMHVFVSHVRENKDLVDDLCRVLADHGVRFWLDRNDIPGGTSWKEAIRRAINQGDFFIACFSREYAERTRTYMNEELTLAIEELRLRPRETAWFIPVVFSGEVPDWDIGAGRTLRDLQRIDLGNEVWTDGILRVLEAIGVTNPEEQKESRAVAISAEAAGLIGGNSFPSATAAAQWYLGLRYMPARVEIHRDKRVVGMIVSYSVLVDGAAVGHLGSGETERLFVSPGNRQFQLYYHREGGYSMHNPPLTQTSNVLTRRLLPEKEYRFRCRFGSFLRGWPILLEDA